MAASQPSNGVPVMTEPTRESLVSRQLPEMTLSTGDETSKTAPPLPIPHYLDATGRALYRFSVEGNAICM
jgi:sorbose reductase